jgi:hypothetical protein
MRGNWRSAYGESAEIAQMVTVHRACVHAFSGVRCSAVAEGLFVWGPLCFVGRFVRCWVLLSAARNNELMPSLAGKFILEPHFALASRVSRLHPTHCKSFHHVQPFPPFPWVQQASI